MKVFNLYIFIFSTKNGIIFVTHKKSIGEKEINYLSLRIKYKKTDRIVSQNIFKFLKTVIITLVALYGLLVILLKIPVVQEQLTIVVQRQLTTILDTPVGIEHINIGYPDRIILDNVSIKDLQGEQLLQVARLSARFEWIPLLRDGRISIHTAQIFGLQANINRQYPKAPLNLQFIIDRLSTPKDTTSENKLDLRINSLLVRRSKVNYDVVSEKNTPERFNPNHLAFSNINANISLKSLNKDSVNLHIKRFDFKEYSGFTLKGLEAHMTGNKRGIHLQDFKLNLPQSHLSLNELKMDFQNDSIPFRNFIMNGGLAKGSHLTPSDIASFIPALSNFNSKLNLSIPQINASQRHTEVMSFKISSPQQEVNLEMTDIGIYFTGETPYVKAVLKNASINANGFKFLLKNLGKENELPTNLHSIQNLQLKGTLEGPINQVKTHMALTTGIGNMEADATLGLSPQGALASCEGNINSAGMDLSKLLGEKAPLGKASMELYFNGNMNGEIPQVYVKGTFPTLNFNNYEYQRIHLDGIIKPYIYEGIISLDDPNGSMYAHGYADFTDKWSNIQANIKIRNLRPHDLLLTEEREGFGYSANISADFSGNSPDNIIGELRIDSLLATTPKDTFLMKELTMNANVAADGGYRILSINSDFMNAFFEGELEVEKLTEDLTRIVGENLPSLTTPSTKRYTTARKGDNNFTVDINLQASKFYPYVLGIPLEIKPSMTVKGFINSDKNLMELTGNVYHLTYNGNEYESGSFKYRKTEERSTVNVQISKHQKNNERMTMMLNANAENDSLKTKFNWGNDAITTYAGTLNAEATFARNQSDILTTLIKISPSDVIINDSIWKVSESTIRIDSGHVHIDNFGAQNENQHLAINGSLTDRPTDSLTIDLNRIAIEYILDIVRFNAVEFSGLATGKVYVKSPFDGLQAHTHLNVQNFHFNNGLLGDMDVTGKWDEEIGILIDADIREGNVAHTTVNGFISPQQNGLDLQIDANETNLTFLNSFLGGIFSDIEGRAKGNMHLYGSFKNLNLIGDAVGTVGLTPYVLNTPLTIKNDTIRMRQEYIELPSATLYDKEGHTALIAGRLAHQHLKNMSYDFQINMNEFLFYDTNDFGNMPFKGNLYGTGNGRLYGEGNKLNVKGGIETAPGTLFTFNLATSESLTDNHFVNFVDKTIRPQNIVVTDLDLFEQDNQENNQEESNPLNISIDVEINATPNAQIVVLMDEQGKNYIEATGTGNLKLDFNDPGETNLKGTYNVENGKYKMNVEDVLHKELLLKKDSKVDFSGNGMDAELNLTAIYEANSVLLSDLIPEANFKQNSVQANSIINITGKLDNPILGFDIDLPKINEEEKQLVRSAISTEEEMRRQALSILGIGKFYTLDRASVEGQQSSNVISSLLSSTISGQLNNLLSQAFNTNNWTFSSNLSTGKEGWNEMEVEGNLNGRILNNRLLFNGNFGYRENEMRKSSFVGDVDLQYLITRSGSIRGKFYNITNDRYFAKQTFYTQGAGFTFNHSFNRWRDLFRRKNKRK